MRAVFITVVLFLSVSLTASDIVVTGRVSDPDGNPVPGALVKFTLFSTDFASVTYSDGTYRLKISGIYPSADPGFKAGLPFPNPFASSVRIPFIIPSDGQVRFSIYNLNGARVYDRTFNSVQAGSYRIAWDGYSQSGAKQGDGLYIYAISYGRKTYSGRLILARNSSFIPGSTGLEPFMFPDDIPDQTTGDPRFDVVSTVSCAGFHTTRMTDISVFSDTTINLTLIPYDELPYKVSGDFIASRDGTDYKNIIIKGVNLGSAPPGYFPGEIAYSISPDMYERWIGEIAETGFNAIRVYTLHPPLFYEKLAEYNLRHTDDPLYLFQGIWLDEVDDPSNQEEYDLFSRSAKFRTDIREVIDCIHGNREIDFRPGRAYGDYLTDISPWVAGYIIGREVSPMEIGSTDILNSGISSWSGNSFSITAGSPSEVFITRMLDETATFEQYTYETTRTLSFSSWPTLDPLVHPTEIYTDEDVASVDITKILELGSEPLLFASYHAYPYYPDFISDDPLYRTYSDDQGPDSYLGYLSSLRDHYGNIPLIIAEFGVPSSWGNAHNSFSGMNHGGHSEIDQGNMNIRMMRNILTSGAGGGFMFSWMDEWFKRTWIVEYMEAQGFISGSDLIPTRQLWNNVVSPEQNFGLIAFEQVDPFPSLDYLLSSQSDGITMARASSDNSYFNLDITTGSEAVAGDSVMIGIDTYLAGRGESVMPGGYLMSNRSEFMLVIKKEADSLTLYVTQAYDMNGFTPRFNLTDPSVQKFRSTITDGAPWKIITWINNGFTGTTTEPGKMPAGGGVSPDIQLGEAASWNGTHIRVRLPWTLLNFRDPTRMAVIDGAVSYDGGYSFEIEEFESDGIALTFYLNGKITSTANRYSWPTWLVVPATRERAKGSLEIVRNGLLQIPDHSY